MAHALQPLVNQEVSIPMSVRQFALALPLLMVACNQDALTREEAVDALEESSIESQASALTSGPVEISTNFTIGSAVEKRCGRPAGLSRRRDPLREDHHRRRHRHHASGAAAGGTCTYKGLTYSGTSSVTVRKTDPDAQVDHTLTNLSNGKVKVNGTANVTWSGAEHSRHVVHELTWTRLSDNRTGTGSGDRTQTLLYPSQGLAGGIRIDGNRHWSGKSGEWDLAITGVEVGCKTPAPRQASTPSPRRAINRSRCPSAARAKT